MHPLLDRILHPFATRHLPGELCAKRSHPQQLYMWQCKYPSTRAFNQQSYTPPVIVDDDAWLYEKAIPSRLVTLPNEVPIGWMSDAARRVIVPPNPKSKYVAAIIDFTDYLCRKQRGRWMPVGAGNDPTAPKPPRRMKQATDIKLGRLYVFA